VPRITRGLAFARPMYQVIARKYRPQTFQDVVNQEHVKTTLENAIALHRIAHGYIFSGQRGTGKTTIARILARCLNCVEGPTATPCGKCASCLEITAGGTVDVIEIDAASNRGINEMRELRENVRYQPARDRYKVFIVDEAHQITNEAFNALLKTIEEPPPWVVFVLCTTEAHKIPATIASRCQHFSFRSVDFEDLVERMAWICKQEGIEADSEALAVLAQAGEGSVRDALSALDQAIACCGAKLDAREVRALLGAFSLESLEMVAQALLESDSRRMLEVVDELERNGHNLQHFSRELARYFRNLLVARIAGQATRLIAASPAQRQRLAEIASKFSEEDLTRYLQLSLDVFKDLQFSLQPRFHLEIGLVRLVQAGRLLPIEQALAELGGGGLSPPPAPKPKAVFPTIPEPGPRTILLDGEEGDSLPRKSGPSPFEQDRARKAAAPKEEGRSGDPPHDARAQLHKRLSELGHAHLADAVENSRIAVSGSDLRVATSKNYKIYFGDAAMADAVREVFGKPLRLSVTVDEGGGPSAPLAPSVPQENEVRDRALANPEVQRFQQVFEGSRVYKVRNLKEST
jgi:DNA polymerase-3 subunit gamma/tau